MTVWSHLPTIFNRRYALRFAGLTMLCVALITTLFFSVVTNAAPGVNSTLSFQGRLLNSTGGVVPDGHYNIQFKIYQDGTGTVAGNPGGTLEWTETYVNDGGNSGVEVKNGYFSVSLGSVTPLSGVDWNQDTLWLSMNVAGDATNCTEFDEGSCEADGEMTPMKRITSVPSALNSARLGGKTADDFLQIAQGMQTDSSDSPSSLSLNKTGTGHLIQLQNSGVDVLTIEGSGDISFGGNSNKTISIGTAANNIAGAHLDIVAGSGGAGTGATGGDMVVRGGDAGGSNGNAGNLIIDSGAKTGTGSAGNILIGSVNAGAITLGNTAVNSTNTINGTTVFKTVGVNSIQAFQIQRADSTAMFIADSANQTITLGDPASAHKTVISTATGKITKYGNARNTHSIKLTAEYAGSVLDAGSGSNNTGMMTSGVNLTDRMNYYKWTTSQATNQSYDVVVQVPIPQDFDGWASSNPLSIAGYTSNTTSGTILLEARDSTGAIRCNFVSVTPSSTGIWSNNNTACTLSSGTYTPGDHLTLRLRMQSPTDGDVRIGTITLDYLSKY